MKNQREEKQRYLKLSQLVNKAEKKAIEFVKKNLSIDSELRPKSSSSSYKYL